MNVDNTPLDESTSVYFFRSPCTRYYYVEHHMHTSLFPSLPFIVDDANITHILPQDEPFCTGVLLLGVRRLDLMRLYEN